MPTTTTYALRYPALTDAPNGPQAFQNLANDVELLGLMVPVALLTAGAGTVLAAGVFTTIALSTEIYDTHNGHSTVTNNSRYTVPAGWGGYYLISAKSDVPATPTGSPTKGGRFLKNSSALAHTQTLIDDAGLTSIVLPATVVQLAPADFIEFQIFQNGATGGTPSVAAQTMMSINFLRRS